jgi:glycosyltransferase involved in cell wall biosynthesis
MKEIISIIVPVYNVEAFVRRCVASILRQTYRNIEVILVDDGSTDNSSKICDELAANDTRIKVIHKRNGGLSSARNRGIIESKGDFFGFVDSDDCIREDMYEVLLKKMLEYNADIAKADFQYFSETDNKFPHLGNGEVVVYDSWSALDNFMNVSFSEKKHLKSTIWDGLYRKSLFLESDSFGGNKLVLSFPEGKINEDTYIFPELLLRAKNIIHISETFYFYYVRENSIVHSPVTNREINSRMLWKDINEKLLKYTDKYVNTCTYNWACRYIELIKKVYDSSFRDEYFEIILNELLKDREYLNQHLTDQRIKRTLCIIHHYKFYLLIKKYVSRFLY